MVTSVGVLMSVLHFPERLFPGRFDLVLNSHHFLHVFGVMGAYFAQKAVLLDFRWVDQGGSLTCAKIIE